MSQSAHRNTLLLALTAPLHIWHNIEKQWGSSCKLGLTRHTTCWGLTSSRESAIGYWLLVLPCWAWSESDQQCGQRQAPPRHPCSSPSTTLRASLSTTDCHTMHNRGVVQMPQPGFRPTFLSAAGPFCVSYSNTLSLIRCRVHHPQQISWHVPAPTWCHSIWQCWRRSSRPASLHEHYNPSREIVCCGPALFGQLHSLLESHLQSIVLTWNHTACSCMIYWACDRPDELLELLINCWPFPAYKVVGITTGSTFFLWVTD